MGVAHVAGNPAFAAPPPVSAAPPLAAEATPAPWRDIPATLQAFVRQPQQAAELLLALVASPSATSGRAGQRWADSLHPSLRLPVAQLTFPAIRHCRGRSCASCSSTSRQASPLRLSWIFPATAWRASSSAS